MIGAIAGDIIGSVYEHRPIRSKEFPLFHPESRFTDDTVLTVAVADAVLGRRDYAGSLLAYGRAHPRAGYGGAFARWLRSGAPEPYGSWGNGSAMRVSPVGFAFDTAERVLAEARATAVPTHDHPEGVKGAQATALAVFLARTTRDKERVRREVTRRFGYDLDRTVDGIRPGYGFDVSCRGTVPPAIVSFLEATSFEDAVRNAVSLGGDSDTLACIAGGIADAFFGGVPPGVLAEVKARLPAGLWRVVEAFSRRFGR